jgi:predicted RNA binding protein YcfA (HicA-like mRNA interferase family)
MRLPRDLGGEKLAVLLRRYGYEVTRQTGSHMRLTT